MPGAGTRRLANWLCSVGPQDGSAIGHIGRGIPLQKLLSKKLVKLDGKKYQWIDYMNKENSICLTSSYSKALSFDNLLKYETIVGALAARRITSSSPFSSRTRWAPS